MGEAATAQRVSVAGAVAVVADDPQPGSDGSEARHSARRTAAGLREVFDDRIWAP